MKLSRLFRRWLPSIRSTPCSGMKWSKPFLWELETRDTPSVSLVKDINTAFDATGSNPSNFVTINGWAYFTATTSGNGTELWKTDGSAAGTKLVKDINAGAGNSNPSNLTNVDGMLFFSADNGANGVELWKSDGTESGTVLVKDVWQGSSGSIISNFASANGMLYFAASNGISGLELWKSDGTDTGTSMVKDITTGANGSNPKYLTNVNGTVYFSANPGVNNAELWKTDGTAAGTVLVKEIEPSTTQGAQPMNLVAVGSTLYFTARTDANGRELWKSNGTSAGTVLVKDIYTGNTGSNPNSSTPSSLTNVNGTLFFLATEPTTHQELWKTDGTAAGTVLVKDIRPGTDGSNIQTPLAVGNTLYFQALTDGAGRELWKSDGTSAGTVMIKDLIPGTTSSFPVDMTNVGNTVYFRAYSGVSGNNELWKSDGTTAGTVLVKDIRIGTAASTPDNFIALNGKLIFTADDGISGNELWTSDGTTAGTILLKDIRTGTADSGIAETVYMNGFVYFRADNGTSGSELWKSDGTTAGTVLVKDVNIGAIASSPRYLLESRGRLFFSARVGTVDQLWVTDGTSAGTRMLRDDTGFLHAVDVNGTVYFAHSDLAHWQLWKTNGTSAGTVRVTGTDFGPSFDPTELTNVNGTLFMRARTNSTGYEVWKSDGTANGTVMVKDIYAGGSAFSFLPSNLTAVGGILYFVSAEVSKASTLWRTDGTAAGTIPLSNALTKGNSSTATVANVNGTVFFTASDGIRGEELWKSDGTESGTVLVKDIRPGSVSSNAHDFTVVGGRLYFLADDGIHGDELWVSDGTNAGTMIVKDIRTGSPSASIRGLTAFHDMLFFSANDGVSGNELWKTDGTEAGTRIAAEAFPGAGGVSPTAIVAADNKVLFAANDETHGSELWAVTYSAPTGITLIPATINENAPSNTLVGVLATDDPDSNDSFKYSLVMGAGSADNGTFTILGNRLFANATLDFEARQNYSIRVQTTDEAGFTFEQSIAITVSDVNETPTLVSLSKSSLAENEGTNAIVGTLSTTDPDTTPQTFTYTIVGGDSGFFNVDGDALRANASFDFETRNSYTVRIRSTDQGGLWAERDFTVTVTDVNETPTLISLSKSSLAENAGANAVIGTLSSMDPDTTTQSFTYTIVGGDAGFFNIDGETLRANASFNYEARNGYTIRIRSTDQGGLWTERDFAIAVTDVNEAPTAIVLSNNTVNRNFGPNTVVGTLSSVDPDFPPQSFTYSLVAGSGSTNNGLFNVVGNQLRVTNSFALASGSSYSVRLRSTDQGGASYEQVFIIVSVPVYVAPPLIALTRTNGSSTNLIEWVGPDGTALWAVPVPAGFGAANVAAVSDRDNDGYADLILGSQSGLANQLGLVSGKTGALLWSTTPFISTFKGGVNVAVGDLNGDAQPEIVVAPASSGGPNVRAFQQSGMAPYYSYTMVRDFNAYASTYTSGVNVAVADLNRDGLGDIVTGTVSGSDNVRAFSAGVGTAMIADFFAFNRTGVIPGFIGGVSVAAGDVNGDGYADLIAGTQTQYSRVRVYSGGVNAGLANTPNAVLQDFNTSTAKIGVQVMARDFDGNGKTEIATLTVTDSSVLLNAYGYNGSISPNSLLTKTYSRPLVGAPPVRIG